MFNNNCIIAVVAVILLVTSEPSYARKIIRQGLMDAQLVEVSLNDDHEMSVNLLKLYNEESDLKTTSNTLLPGDLQCFPSGSTCYFFYPELCCSGMCKLTSKGPFGHCLGN